MTLGTLTGCLHRATNMNEEEVTKLLVLNSVRSQQTAGVEATRVLETILHKSHGETIVRNLIALILNGSIDKRGKTATNPVAIQARSIAESVFEELKNIFPGFEPIKGSCKIHLSTPQDRMAKEVHGTLRQHFATLPQTIVSTMKIEMDPGDIPTLDLPNVEDEATEDKQE
ncbi:MAG: hypothetical protein J3Q66DRAFT_369071 [Benniella sp.]|nr:MAG: hypothetical protein J3Q66DRAFT_369071 [Benniella sp.]